MRAILNGHQPGNLWSDPAAWANGKVPVSSHHLDIRLEAFSTESLGTAQNPFVTDDVIGAASGLTLPGLFVTGFLHADNIANLSDLQMPSSSGVTIKHDLINVQNVEAHDGGFLDVGHDLVKVQHVSISFGSMIDVGHSIGKSSIVFGIGGGSLILDHPGHRLDNAFSLGLGGSPAIVELGRVRFDAADFVPNAPGSLTGKIDLTEHGRQVFQFDHVTESAPAGVLTVGVDHTTGFDFVSYHA
jgi:hypothetical protein